MQVNVALAYRKDGILIKRRGTSLPVEVHQCAGKDYLTFTAKAKHAAFNKRFIDSNKEYILLYHDLDIVETLPGTRQPFSLARYREMIGKRFHRITFYLCEKADYCGKIFMSKYCSTTTQTHIIESFFCSGCTFKKDKINHVVPSVVPQ